MPHDNPRLIGDFTPRPLSSAFLDLMGKPPSGILQASMQKEKRPLLLILQPEVLPRTSAHISLAGARVEWGEEV